MKAQSGALQHVAALIIEVYGEHLMFLDSEGKLAALFSLEIVESRNEIASEPVAANPRVARSGRG
jgi:hypothetical protein